MVNRPLKTTLVCGQLAVAIALGGALNGCGQESDETAAIRQARADLDYLAAKGTLVAEGAPTRITYDKIVSNLTKAAGSSSPGEASAAKVIRARASARLADQLSSKAALIEQRVLDQVVGLRATLDQWQNLSAAATALNAFDPKASLAELDKQAAAKDSEIAQAQSALSALEAGVATLEKDTAEALEKSRAERARETEFRTQSVDKSQTERADLITKANEARRAADTFDRTASEIGAEIAKQTPAVTEAKLNLAALRSARALIDTSKADIDRMVKINAAQSKRTVDGERDKDGNIVALGTRQLAEDITRRMADLQKLRESGLETDESTSSLADLYERAEQLYASAASEAAKAKSGGGKSSSADLDIASYEHSLADVLVSKTRGLQEYALMLASLAAAKPPLPTDFSADATEAKTAFDAALIAAQDAYTKSKTSYERAGSQERVENVKNRIEEIARRLSAFDPRNPEVTEPVEDDAAAADAGPDAVGGEVDPAAPDQPKPEVATAGLEGEVTTFALSLQADLKKPDIAAFGEKVIFRNDKQKENFAKMLPLRQKGAEFDNACLEHFGKVSHELAKEHAADLAGTFIAGFAGADQEDLALAYLLVADASDYAISPSPDDPDGARLTSKSGKVTEPLAFRKVDGVWKFLNDTQNDVSEMPESMIQPILATLDRITSNVKANKYNRDAVAMLKDLGAELQKAILEAIPEDEGK